MPMMDSLTDFFKTIKWYIKYHSIFDIKEKEVEKLYYVKRLSFNKNEAYTLPLLNLIKMKNGTMYLVAWRTNWSINEFTRLYSEKMETSIPWITIYQDADLFCVMGDTEKLMDMFFKIQSNIVTLQVQIKEITNTYELLGQKVNNKYDILSCEEIVFHNNNQSINWKKDINYCAKLECKNKETGEKMNVNIFDINYKELLEKGLIEKSALERIKNELNIDLLKLPIL